jgi:hypothetical protein
MMARIPVKHPFNPALTAMVRIEIPVSRLAAASYHSAILGESALRKL